MKQILFSGLLSLLSILLLPVRQAAPAGQVPAQRVQMQDLVLFIEEVPVEEPERQVRLRSEDGVTTLSEEDYLTAVVLCEMPTDFHEEALKAQAVAARTFLYRKQQHPKHDLAEVCGDSACCQAWADDSAISARFSEADIEKARGAVSATREEALYYGDALIDATYFSCSGGRTEAAVAVWGGDVPYLQSVESFGEEAAPRYESEVHLSPAALRKKLDLDVNTGPETWLGGVTRTEGGGVASCAIGGSTFSGTQLRQLLGLNSTDFDLTYDGGRFVFHVRGFGHRVGMSQYGANFMAEQGFSYEQILKYYYQDVEIRA